eukprot:1154291-Pelagomonas_calceolata.AAC.2
MHVPVLRPACSGVHHECKPKSFCLLLNLDMPVKPFSIAWRCLATGLTQVSSPRRGCGKHILKD